MNDEPTNSHDLVPITTRGGFPVSDSAVLVLRGHRDGVHPVESYMHRLSQSSHRTMLQSLNSIARLCMGTQEIDAMRFDWAALRYQHCAWIRSQLQDDLAPATANKAMAALRGVLKEAWRLGHMTAEDYHRAIDTESVPGFRLPRGRMLTVGEMRSFFESCATDRTKSAVLDAALFAALAGGGLRRDEACGLHLDDFGADEKTLNVLGKGNKQRTVPLQSTATSAINLWVNVRGFEPGALFCPVRKNGIIELRAMTTKAIYRRLQRRALRAGVKSFTPHDLRRTYASGMLEAGADVFAVQKLLGHADVKTTGRYDMRDEASKRNAADLFHLPYVEFTLNLEGNVS